MEYYSVTEKKGNPGIFDKKQNKTKHEPSEDHPKWNKSRKTNTVWSDLHVEEGRKTSQKKR